MWVSQGTMPLLASDNGSQTQFCRGVGGNYLLKVNRLRMHFFNAPMLILNHFVSMVII